MSHRLGTWPPAFRCGGYAAAWPTASSSRGMGWTVLTPKPIAFPGRSLNRMASSMPLVAFRPL